ncbi:MAG: serine/threonine-protein kinase, partial [bacterium]|nr:serine/threonine-protein kinase [bacterium]
PQEKVLEWGCQVLEILVYLHSKNIIFRDIKPSNIILDVEGKINLVDFGIARRIFPATEILSAETRIGTPQYAPDEQYEGKTDPRSDIFALGLVMIELLTGQSPRIRFIPELSSEEFHPELIKIVAKSLHQRPECRYRNAQEMLDELINFINAKYINLVDILKILDEIKTKNDIPGWGLFQLHGVLDNNNFYSKIKHAQLLEKYGHIEACKKEIKGLTS